MQSFTLLRNVFPDNLCYHYCVSLPLSPYISLNEHIIGGETPCLLVSSVFIVISNTWKNIVKTVYCCHTPQPPQWASPSNWLSLTWNHVQIFKYLNKEFIYNETPTIHHISITNKPRGWKVSRVSWSSWSPPRCCFWCKLQSKVSGIPGV